MIKMTFPLALNCLPCFTATGIYSIQPHYTSRFLKAGSRGLHYFKPPDIQTLLWDMFYKSLNSKKKKKVNMINPENLTWEPLMKVHLSNERDCSATSVIYEFELNYDAVTNKTNILEATNFGERFISGSCLGPCRWAMLASISSSPWDEGRTSTPN